MKSRRPHFPVLSISAWLVLGSCAGWLLASAPAKAGPITGGAGNAPFTKAAVYGGVVSIVPGGAGVPAMELGNGGTDIAGTSDLFFRPGGVGQVVTQANSIQVYKAGGNTNIYVPGKVCLAAGTVSEACQNVWSTVSSGPSSWGLSNEPGPLGPNVNYLQPIATYSQFGIRIGSAPGINLDPVVTFGTGATILNKDSSGLAVRTVGNVESSDWTTADGILTINGLEAWHATSAYHPIGSEGRNTGLDADKLDGVDVKLEPATACTTNPGIKVACLCFYFQNGTQKRCADLANRS